VNDIFISYDLRKPGRDYAPLWNEIKRFGGRRVLESLWQFQSEYTSKQIRDHFLRFVDTNDGVLVMNVGDWAGMRLASNPSSMIAVA
jgi:hypothetical protein